MRSRASCSHSLPRLSPRYVCSSSRRALRGSPPCRWRRASFSPPASGSTPPTGSCGGCPRRKAPHRPTRLRPPACCRSRSQPPPHCRRLRPHHPPLAGTARPARRTLRPPRAATPPAGHRTPRLVLCPPARRPAQRRESLTSFPFPHHVGRNHAREGMAASRTRPTPSPRSRHAPRPHLP